MKKLKSISCLFLALALIFLCSCADTQAAPAPDLGAKWCETAADILSRGSYADYLLVSSVDYAGMAANKVLSFDAEGRLGMGGYVFGVNDGSIVEVFAVLKAFLVERYGQPQGHVHQTAEGESPDNWEQTLALTDRFQMVWNCPEGLCYLNSAIPGRMMISYFSTNADSDFGGMPWGLSVDSLADWDGLGEYTKLVDLRAEIYGSGGYEVYSFDDGAKLSLVWYEFRAASAEEAIAVYKNLQSTLKELYGEPVELEQIETAGASIPIRTITDVEADGVLSCADVWRNIPAPEGLRVEAILQLNPDGNITLTFSST